MRLGKFPTDESGLSQPGGAQSSSQQRCEFLAGCAPETTASVRTRPPCHVYVTTARQEQYPRRILTSYLVLPCFWVSADPAAALADLEALGSRKVLAAADAALEPVTSLLPVCVNADAAADLAALLAVLLRRVVAAADAADFPVLSLRLLAILFRFLHVQCVHDELMRRYNDSIQNRWHVISFRLHSSLVGRGRSVGEENPL